MLRFIEHFFCGSRYWFSGTKICGCFWEIGNSYGSNGKALESSARRSFLWRIYGYLLRVRQVLPYGLIQRRRTKESSFGCSFEDCSFNGVLFLQQKVAYINDE